MAAAATTSMKAAVIAMVEVTVGVMEVVDTAAVDTVCSHLLSSHLFTNNQQVEVPGMEVAAVVGNSVDN